VGSALLLAGYIPALIALGAVIVVLVPFGAVFLDSVLGRSTSGRKLTLRDVFIKGRNVNVLSCARFFLFGSRDLWFEVVLPVFLRGWFSLLRQTGCRCAQSVLCSVALRLQNPYYEKEAANFLFSFSSFSATILSLKAFSGGPMSSLEAS
jgi:hypothetical protein